MTISEYEYECECELEYKPAESINMKMSKYDREC